LKKSRRAASELLEQGIFKRRKSHFVSVRAEHTVPGPRAGLSRRTPHHLLY
jgi:hypothetical protein